MFRIGTALLTLTVAGMLGAAVTAAPASARGNVLPDETYTALVQTLDAQIDLPDRASTLSLRRQLAESRSICRMLSADDELLAAHRKQCLASVRTIELMTRDCKTERGCTRAWKRTIASYDETYRLTVATNKVIDRTVPAGRCRTVLRTSASELRAIREAGRVQKDLLRAAQAEDKRALKAIEKRAKRLAKLKVRTPEEIQDAIVAHC